MKVLWFEVTEPSPYKLDGIPIGGWQDSLERIVKTVSDIDLTVCFMSEKYTEVKVVDGVTYVPIFCKWSFIERKFCKYWDVYVRKILVGAKQIVEEYKPDLIHVFGMEWPFGQIAAHTEVPVVVHIMGTQIIHQDILNVKITIENGGILGICIQSGKLKLTVRIESHGNERHGNLLIITWDVPIGMSRYHELCIQVGDIFM